MASRRSKAKVVEPVRMLGFDDLVDALLDEQANRERPPEYSGYYAKRLEAVETVLGTSFRVSLGRGGGDRDVSSVRRIARGTAEQLAKLYGPFGSYLEGAPGPLETAVRIHRGAVDAAIASLRRALRATFAECLRVLDPTVEARTAPESKLFELGVPRRSPDEDDW